MLRQSGGVGGGGSITSGGGGGGGGGAGGGGLWPTYLRLLERSPVYWSQQTLLKYCCSQRHVCTQSVAERPVHHQLQDPSLAKANTVTAAVYESLDSRLVEWTR